MDNGMNFVRRCWVEVDLQVLKENIRLYRESLRSSHEIMAVVKANAYGHGDVQVSKTLQECGIRHFAVSNIEEAIDLAVKAEHGNRHTAHMHSKNIDHLSAFAKAVETTIFVKNAPSYAGIGFGGEGHTTFTIAGPTGEGITSAKSFTRLRRCVLAESFRII